MKLAPLILLLLVACGPEAQPQPPVAAPSVHAQPANQFGHLSPIQLPPGEFWDGWQVTGAINGPSAVPERYYFSTTTNHLSGKWGTHTLRTAQGIPVLIVKDPGA